MNMRARAYERKDLLVGYLDTTTYAGLRRGENHQVNVCGMCNAGTYITSDKLMFHRRELHLSISSLPNSILSLM